MYLVENIYSYGYIVVGLTPFGTERAVTHEFVALHAAAVTPDAGLIDRARVGLLTAWSNFL